MGNIRTVIFDRDGVLADFDYQRAGVFFENLPITLDELGQRWQRWGELYGFPSNLEQEREFFDGFWGNLGEELRISTRDLEKFRSFNYAEYLLLFPDVQQILEWLKQQEIGMGVLTNFTLASVEMSLKALGIREYFEAACAATVIGVAKPDTKAYKAVMEQLHADPTKTLFFDDEIQHVIGARAAGIENSYFVDRSARDHDLPHRKVRDLSAITDIVEMLEN